MLMFQKDQKVAIINHNGRPIEALVEKVTKTKLTIRYPNGHIARDIFNIREDRDGNQEGRHARSSHQYWREHVEIWTEKHDARVAEKNAEMETYRQLNAIKDSIAKLHVSDREMIVKLAQTLNLILPEVV